MDPSFGDGVDLLCERGRLGEERGEAAASRVAAARVLWRRFLVLLALTRSAARNSSEVAWSNCTTSWSTDEPTRCRSPCVTASLEEASVAPTVVAIYVWSKSFSVRER